MSDFKTTLKDGEVQLNTTEKIGPQGILSDTLGAYEKWDMNELKDPANVNPVGGPKMLGGSDKK